MIQDVAPVKDKGGVHHRLVDGLIVQFGELGPLGGDGDGVGALRRGVGVGFECHPVGHVLQVDAGALQRVRVGEDDLGVLLQQLPADGQGGRFARVAGVGLEGRAKDGDALVGDGVEHGRHHLGDKARLLVVVHLDHLLPVPGCLVQAIVLAQVGEIENVLLEARAAKADAGPQEAEADAAVGADGVGHLRHVGAGPLAQVGDSVDR